VEFYLHAIDNALSLFGPYASVFDFPNFLTFFLIFGRINADLFKLFKSRILGCVRVSYCKSLNKIIA
jgi:hypothetical protein